MTGDEAGDTGVGANGAEADAPGANGAETDAPGPDGADADATGANGAEADAPGADDAGELPDPTVEEVERLTRLAREATDPAEREAYLEARAELLAPHDFTARVRDADDVLVCHPAEWVEDGTIRTDRVEDTDRAVEIPLSGPGDPDDWAAVASRNESVAAAVREAHGEVHGANAEAFADFMSNHYARTIGSAGEPVVDEFLEEYFPRNAWPDDDQREVVERSIKLAIELARDD